MHNNVSITGRLGSNVTVRNLPSGDEVTSFTVIVERPEKERVGSTKVDSIPCQTFRVSVASKVLGLDSGTLVTAQGVLRRRFWKVASGLGSAMEVEVRSLKRA
jgi:single-strand DNA-binding protein